MNQLISPRSERMTQLMLVLTFSTGIVDAASYLGLHHVFVANMTGNVVFIGLGAFAGHSGIPVARSLVALGGFFGGAALAGFFQRLAPPGQQSLRRCAVVLSAVTAILACLVVAIICLPLNEATLNVLTVPFAAAMGAQAAAARIVAVAEISTVVVTSTMVSLAAEPWFGPLASPRTPRRLLAVGAIGAGAAAGALLLRLNLWAPVLLAAAVSAAASIAFSHEIRREASAQAVRPAD